MSLLTIFRFTSVLLNSFQNIAPASFRRKKIEPSALLRRSLHFAGEPPSILFQDLPLSPHVRLRDASCLLHPHPGIPGMLDASTCFYVRTALAIGDRHRHPVSIISF